MRALSERQRATLAIIGQGGAIATPIYIRRLLINNYRLDTSGAGLRNTADSLVRRGLARHVTTARSAGYRITPAGRKILAAVQAAKGER